MDCDFYRICFLIFSLSIVGLAVWDRGSSRRGAGVAFILTGLFYLASIVRQVGINSDTISYAKHAEVAAKITLSCYLDSSRFEPINGVLLWSFSNLGWSPELSYFSFIALAFVGLNAMLWSMLSDRYLLFVAITYPQFGLIEPLSTLRWGLALNVLAVAYLTIRKYPFVLRSPGYVAVGALHFAVMPAAGIASLRDWRIQVGLTSAFVAILLWYLPSVGLESGTGMRYGVALLASLGLMLASEAKLRDDGYYQHLAIIGCSVIVSLLFIKSPHYIRFAVPFLWISYVPLCMFWRRAGVSRTAIMILMIVPALALANEVRRNTCEVWSGDRSSNVRSQESAANEAYGLMFGKRDQHTLCAPELG